MDKKLYAQARYPLYLAFFSIFVMIIILLIKIKWIVIGGLFLSFLTALVSVSYGIVNLRYISKNDTIYRGESMSWISICLGVLAMLCTLPFVVAWILAV
jgi:hypothetical protein